MNKFAKSMLAFAVGLGMSTSAFAQSGPLPTAPSKPEVSKAAPAAPSSSSKTPAKKSAVKPAEVKKNESGTAHNGAKDLQKQEPAKTVK